MKLAVAVILGLVLGAVEAVAQEAMPVLIWGKEGTTDGQFTLPSAIAIDAFGNLFVTDDADRVQKFTRLGEFLASWGGAGTGEGQFNTPSGLATDAQGNVYVADWGNHRIQKFSGSGAFLTSWGEQGSGDGQFQGPVAVALDDDGIVYVVDQNNHRIQKFDADGTFVGKWGSPGSADGNLFWPRGIVVSGDEVYVTDSYDRVQRFDTDGNFQLRWGITGSNLGQMKSPLNLTVAPSGDVYVADAGNHRIQQFTHDGTYIAFYGRYLGLPTSPIPASGDAPGWFNRPIGVVCDASGDFYVADRRNNRIQRFSTEPLPVEPITWGRLKTRFAN